MAMLESCPLLTATIALIGKSTIVHTLYIHNILSQTIMFAPAVQSIKIPKDSFMNTDSCTSN